MTDLVTGAWSALTLRLSLAYESYCVMPVFERFEPLRAALLGGIPPTASTVLEIGPGPGFNVRHYPPSVEKLVALVPQHDAVHDRVFTEADTRRMHVQPLSYVTVDEAKARKLVTDADVAHVTATARRVADALGVPLDPAAYTVIPLASGSVQAAVGTLLLCTVVERELPWLLADLARVLHPKQGRYLFLEHVPTRGVRACGPVRWAWQAVRGAHARIFGGCDIGRARTVVGLKEVFAEVEVNEWVDGRWWAEWVFGKVVMGSGRVAEKIG